MKKEMTSLISTKTDFAIKKFSERFNDDHGKKFRDLLKLTERLRISVRTLEKELQEPQQHINSFVLPKKVEP